MPLAATEVYPLWRLEGSAIGTAVRSTAVCPGRREMTISSAREPDPSLPRGPAPRTQVEDLQSFSNSFRDGSLPTLMETRNGRYIGASFVSVLMFHVSLD